MDFYELDNVFQGDEIAVLGISWRRKSESELETSNPAT